MSIITLTTSETPSGRKTATFSVAQAYADYFGGVTYNRFFIDKIFGISLRNNSIVIQTSIEGIDYTIDNPSQISVNGETYLQSETNRLLSDLEAIAFY